MKLIIIVCFLLMLIFPCYLLYHRKMNATLLIFYAGFVLMTLGDLGGRGGLQSISIAQIILGISGFAIAAGVEFVIRRELALAAFVTTLLLFFAFSWYYLAEQGAFA